MYHFFGTYVNSNLTIGKSLKYQELMTRPVLVALWRDGKRRLRRERIGVGSFLALLVWAACIAGAVVASAEASPPNIVLMLSDNLGFGEIGVYGGGILRGAPTPRDRVWRRPYAPKIFNVEQDPREEVDIGTTNLWILEPLMRQVYPFLFSAEKEGLILPGGDEPEPATVEIPFQRQDEIEKSISAIRWKIMKRKAKELLPFSEE